MKIPMEAIEAAKGLKRYKHYQIPKGVCYDCRLKYSDFEDMIIDDALWELITPVADRDPSAGLLCPTCMVSRLHKIGMWYNSLNPLLSREGYYILPAYTEDIFTKDSETRGRVRQDVSLRGFVHTGSKALAQVKRRLGLPTNYPTRKI